MIFHASKLAALHSLVIPVLLLSILLPNPSLHANDTAAKTSPTAALIRSSMQLDQLCENTLQAMVSGDWVNAKTHAQNLVEQFPNYALGQLLLAETHRVSGMSDTLLQTEANFSTHLVELLLEARSRLLQNNTDHQPSIERANALPTEIIQVGKHIDHVVLVDMRASTLFLFDTKAAQPKLIKQHYISSGEGGFGKSTEGDLKSPLGIYRINGFRTDDSLPPLYGSGALMLNYPNTLDRALGRTGSGIWLHGNPRVNRSRSPQSSEGCVTMANDHLSLLHQQINMQRTHVVLSHSVTWQSQTAVLVQRDRFQELFNQYRHAWVNNRVADLLAIYTPDAVPSHVHYEGRAVAKKVSTGSLKHNKRIAPLGVDLDALASINVADVSLLLNPDLNRTPANKHMVMEFELIGEQTATVTLYWELSRNGYWRIKREVIQASGA